MDRGYKGKMAIAALVAIAMMELVVFGGFGLGVIVSVISMYIGVWCLYRKKGSFRTFFFRWEFLAVALVTLSYGLYDNTLLKVLNSGLLMYLMTLHMTNVFELSEFEKYSPKWFIELLSYMLIRPFQRQKYVREEVGTLFQGVEPSQKETIKKVVIGGCIALPMVVVVAALLVGADAAFQNTVNIILRNINIDFFSIGQRIVTFIVIFLLLLGGYHFLLCPKIRGFDEDGLENEAEEQCAGVKKSVWDFVISMTVMISIASVYVLYVVSQLNYFLSAFGGELPQTYTYAMYARRGFFELIPIILMNMTLVAMMYFKVDCTSARRERVIKVVSTFYIGFTLFIITTSISKMVMYMQLYGLTLKRVYVTWFLVLCFVELAWVVAKIYKEKITLCKGLFISFVVLYLSLNYMDVDYQIAAWNTRDSIQVEDISGYELAELSVSGLIPIIESDYWDTVIASYEEKGYHSIVQDYYQGLMERRGDWRDWNLAYYRAKERYVEWAH